jgi:hypothetical protein
MSTHEGSAGPERVPDSKRGQRVLDLLSDPQEADNAKELKALIGNRSLNEFLNIMLDVHKVHQDTTDETTVLYEQNEQLEDKVKNLRIEHHSSKEKYRERIHELEEEVRKLKARPVIRETPADPLFLDARSRQQSTGTEGSHANEGKRSPKYPDPPTLTDGADPTFKEWETGLKNKFLFNQDWFEDAQETRSHAKRVAYIQTTVKGKAFQHLDSFLDQHEAGKVVTSDMCRKFLRQVFDDPDKRLKARAELNKLKLKYLGDFNDFYSEFVRLANVSKKPRREWKEEIHDKLYEELQVHLEQHVMDDNCNFDAYCQKARHFARGEERVGNKRREIANKRRQQSTTRNQPGRTSASNPQQARNQQASGTNVTPQTQNPSFTCYGCGKEGHLKRDCPDKGETKAVDPIDEEDCEDFEDYDSQTDSENE